MNTEQTIISRTEMHVRRNPSVLQGKRTVICEDEGLTLMQLRRALQRAGLAVVAVATNGKEGVEIVLRERPDLVLMDVQMPKMDGLQATRQILADYQTCIVLLTGYLDAESRAQASALGVSGYVDKPIVSEDLLPLLMEAFAQFCAR